MSYLAYSVWILLALALGTLPKNQKIAFVLLGISCIGFVYLGVLGLSGIAVLISLVLLMLAYDKVKSLWIEIILVLACFALFFHYLPGFANPKILDKVLVSDQSAPFSMYFNLDKALIPFVLCVLTSSLFVQKTHQTSRNAVWGYLALACLVILLLCVASVLGGLRFEFHIPSWLPLFVLANLFFVSFVEETLFRGYIQQRLSHKIGAYPALFAASFVFGFYHFFWANWLFAFFAVLAGVIYGLAWMISRNVWVSTLFHFGLNLTHLIFFTYPFYAPYAPNFH
ncbi:CPBP family intramembrane glutamic endopeptidase [Helicobacter pametensis]|uniref:CPBP family intramembrane glutamic endopeptidase n=1 Tax=Helicobacter pametensis TaxID=95149 RepID=UPI0004BB8838|nr:type II CAAX endopeptidase family protein [Helicobacter pametensis]